MEKYYTPEIEEFHVGFEYQAKVVDYYKGIEDVHGQGLKKKDVEDVDKGEDCDGARYKRYRWCDWKVYEDSFYIPDAGIKWVRVRHLDREDIESFNFKQSILHSNIFLKECDEWNHRSAECIGINFNEGFDHLMIFFVEKGGEIKYGQTIFAGKLKNKSELKRILKQIGL